MKRFKGLIFVFFAVCLFFPFNNSYASSVQDQLQVTIDKIVEILRDPSLKDEGSAKARRQSLSKLIHERFSFEKMSQLSLARHWKDRTQEEKKAFAELFGKLLEETYISKIESYTDEKVVFVKEFVNNKKAQVNTKIVMENIEIPIDYRLYQTKEGIWLVYDLVIEGVSLVGNYRSQFDQILQKDTYEKLVEELKKKINS